MPDYEQVERALLDSIENGEVSRAARARLSRWGAAALPHLRRMAETSLDERLALLVIRAVVRIEGRESAELEVEILEGRTLIRPNLAMHVEPRRSSNIRLRRCLVEHPRFKDAVLAFSASEHYYDLRRVASIAGHLGWKDAVPLVRKMLEHENLGVREAAADALRALTGDDVAATPAPLAFPSTDLRDGLLGEAKSLGQVEQPLFVIPLDVAEAPPQTVTVTARGHRGSGAHAVSRDREGNELWSWLPPDGRITSAVPLADECGTYGVAFGPGGPTSIVALDASGESLWEVRDHHVLYRLSTHPELPARLLHVGWGCHLFAHGPAGARALDTARFAPESAPYATDAKLFPSETGEPSFLVVGSGDAPVVCRYDSRPENQWVATVPDRVCGITMVESPSGRLFAIATESGEVLVFDAAGTLTTTGRVPEVDPRRKIRVFGIESLRDADEDRWALHVEVVEGTFSFQLNV